MLYLFQLSEICVWLGKNSQLYYDAFNLIFLTTCLLNYCCYRISHYNCIVPAMKRIIDKSYNHLDLVLKYWLPPSAASELFWWKPSSPSDLLSFILSVSCLACFMVTSVWDRSSWQVHQTSCPFSCVSLRVQARVQQCQQNTLNVQCKHRCV